MSVDASHVPTANALHDVLCRAGAVFAQRNGDSVAVNYGSAAGELAACVSGVGLADCSALIKLELGGSPETLDAISAQLIGAVPAAGGAVPAGRAWWCGEPSGGATARQDDLRRLILLCEPPEGACLHARLQGVAAQWPALRLVDRSSQWGALAIVGSRAGELLGRLGVYGRSGDPRLTSPFTAHAVGGVPAWWLLQSDHWAVALVDRRQAGRAWHAVERAGGGLGISCIGTDALARHALLERRRGPISLT